MSRFLSLVAVLGLVSTTVVAEEKRMPASGPLRVHPTNPRYFADATGKAVLLVGSHTWPSLVDMGPTDPPASFDFDAYLDFLDRYGHNFIRLWTWESVTWDTRGNSAAWRKKAPHFATPQPWPRTGKGKALDGKPKFDLSRYDPEYFTRLRTRVAAANQRGIYVSIMLFEGWAMQHAPKAWEGHPFHPANNVNGIDGDANGDGRGIEVHELANPKVTAIQEAYVQKVIETVGDLDNVLYEISNENHPASTAWQAHIIRFIKKVEKTRAKQHPVGMTFQYRGGSNKTLFDSPADWVSPNPVGGFRDDPPDMHGRKVVLTDTDHLWGIGGNEVWVWKSVCRGLNPIFMDPYDGVVLGKRFDPQFEAIRTSMGQALRLAHRMDLAAATPHPRLASTKYCLASPGKEYLVYLPGGGSAQVSLAAAKGDMAVEWLNPKTGKTHKARPVEGGASHTFEAPFKGHAVLYIHVAH